MRIDERKVNGHVLVDSIDTGKQLRIALDTGVIKIIGGK